MLLTRAAYALYNRDKHQVTIHAASADATPKPSATC